MAYRVLITMLIAIYIANILVFICAENYLVRIFSALDDLQGNS